MTWFAHEVKKKRKKKKRKKNLVQAQVQKIFGACRGSAVWSLYVEQLGRERPVLAFQPVNLVLVGPTFTEIFVALLSFLESFDDGLDLPIVARRAMDMAEFLRPLFKNIIHAKQQVVEFTALVVVVLVFDRRHDEVANVFVKDILVDAKGLGAFVRGVEENNRGV